MKLFLAFFLATIVIVVSEDEKIRELRDFYFNPPHLKWGKRSLANSLECSSKGFHLERLARQLTVSLLLNNYLYMNKIYALNCAAVLYRYLCIEIASIFSLNIFLARSSTAELLRLLVKGKICFAKNRGRN